MILLHVTPGHGPIWMDGVACSGLETNIADCPFNGWGNNTCDHSVDAGVLCENSMCIKTLYYIFEAILVISSENMIYNFLKETLDDVTS